MRRAANVQSLVRPTALLNREPFRRPGSEKSKLNIVGIGGGTGLPVLLTGLKNLNDRLEEAIDITAIVAVSDSGGSSGSLRRAFEIPAMGDVRNCLLALSGADSTFVSLCRHRFEKVEGLAGHTVGNLILSALYEMSGDFGAAVRSAAGLLKLNGRVLPATDVSVTFCAQYEDGSIVRGESNVTCATSRIKRVWLDPQNPAPSSGVLDAISAADVIVFGPGSLYTSIIANVLIEGIGDAVQRSPAIQIYVCNLMTQPGETDGLSAADHLRILRSYLRPGAIDICILNGVPAGTGVAQRYLKSGSTIVTDAAEDIRRMGVLTALAPLLSKDDLKVRHDPDALARLVVLLARRFTEAKQMKQRRERGVTCAESSDTSVPAKSPACLLMD